MGFIDDIKEEFLGKKYYVDDSVSLSFDEINSIAQELIDDINSNLANEERTQSVEILNGKQEIYYLKVFHFYKCKGQEKDFVNIECKQSGNTQTGKCFLSTEGKGIIEIVQKHLISEGIKCILMVQLGFTNTDYKIAELDQPYKFRIKTSELYNKKPYIRYLIKCIKSTSSSNKATNGSGYQDVAKLTSLYKTDEDILKLAEFAWNSKNTTILRNLKTRFTREINEGKPIHYDLYLSYNDTAICDITYSNVGIAPIKDKTKLKALSNVVFDYIIKKTLEEASGLPELNVSYKHCKVYYEPDCSSTNGGVKIGEADEIWLKTQENNKQGVRPPGYIPPTVYEGICIQIRNTYPVKQLRQL